MFQTPQLYRIGDDAGQHVCRVKKYIDDIKIDDQSEKIKTFIGSLEQYAQFEIFLCLIMGLLKPIRWNYRKIYESVQDEGIESITDYGSTPIQSEHPHSR